MPWFVIWLMVMAETGLVICLVCDAASIYSSIPRDHEAYDDVHWGNYTTPGDRFVGFLYGLLITLMCSILLVAAVATEYWWASVAIAICLGITALITRRERSKLREMARANPRRPAANRPAQPL